jgi:hypothetical protein
VSEPFLEIHKDQIDYLGLHSRRKLLVEGEFLDNHIEVEEQSIFHIAFNFIVEERRNVKRFVGLFNSLDPEVEGFELSVYQVFIGIPPLKHQVDATHHDGVEGQTNELFLLLNGFTSKNMENTYSSPLLPK